MVYSVINLEIHEIKTVVGESSKTGNQRRMIRADKERQIEVAFSIIEEKSATKLFLETEIQPGVLRRRMECVRPRNKNAQGELIYLGQRGRAIERRTNQGETKHHRQNECSRKM